MKILFLTKELPYPINSGARMRTWHYVRGLAQAGEVHMICYGKSEEQGEGITVFRKMGVDVIFEETVPSWQEKPLLLARLMSVVMPVPHAVLLRRAKSFKDKVRHIAQESACHAIVCDGIHMSVNVPFDLSCRKILDEHNVESTIIGRFLTLLHNPLAIIYASWEWLKFRRFEESIWPKFDEIHVCSDVDQQQVEDRSLHPNVKVVPNGVSCQEYGLQKTEDGKPPSSVLRSPFSDQTSLRLVYSGLMGWKPNDDAAIYFIKEVWPLIKENGKWRAENGENQNRPSSVIDHPSSLQFIIVGKGPTPALQALADGDPSIDVTGFVDDVKPYIYGSDVFIVPLRIGSGTRLKILEAMAMGKAVVSTSIGCEGLDVTHGENIFIADDPKSFADWVLRLLNDEELRQQIAQAGRRLVEEKYDWPLIEKKLAKLVLEF